MQKRKVISPLPTKLPSELQPLLLSLGLSKYSSKAQLEPIGDFFDLLDAHQPPFTPILSRNSDEPKSNNYDFIQLKEGEFGPLCDSTSFLYPNLSSVDEMELDLEENEDLPKWLKETSGRVKVIVACQIQLDDIEGVHDSHRVAVGAQDGTIWIFGQERFVKSIIEELEVDRTASQYRTNLSSSISPSPSRHSFDSPSSPDSLNSSQPTRSAHPTVNLRSISASYLMNGGRHPPPSSVSTISSSQRISSTTGSISPSRHSYDINRPRKASATVSINTTEKIEGSPLSPTFPAMGSPTVTVSSPNLDRHHHKSKESISNGIGLWETESVLNFNLEEFDEEMDNHLESEELRELFPLFRIHLNGTAREIAEMKIVGGLKIGRAEGGKVLVVLQADGQLSIHSLLDGRTLGISDIRAKVDIKSRQDGQTFHGFELMTEETTTTAIIYSHDGAGYVFVDLNMLESSKSIDQESNLLRSIIFSSHESTFLLYPSSGGSIPRLLSRQISLAGAQSSIASESIVTEFPEMSSIQGLQNCGDNLLIFDSNCLLIFTIGDQGLLPLVKLDLKGITQVSSQDDMVAVFTENILQTYRIVPGVAETKLDLKLLQELPSNGIDTISPYGNGCFFLARSPLASPRTLEIISPLNPSFVAFTASPRPTSSRITLSVSRDPENVILAFDDGRISLVSYSNFSTSKQQVRLSSAINLLKILTIQNRDILIAGCVGGSAAAWNLSDLSELGRWNLSATAPTSVFLSPTSENSPSLIFISNSSLASISLESFELKFLLPGTNSSIEAVYGKEAVEELLIIYQSGLSRIWNLKSGEFRRSMDRPTSLGVLEGNQEWKVWFESKVENPLSPRLDDPNLTIDLRAHLQSLNQFPILTAMTRSNSNPPPVLPVTRPSTPVQRSATPQPETKPSATVLLSKNSLEIPGSIRFLLSVLLQPDLKLNSSVESLCIEMSANHGKENRYPVISNSGVKVVPFLFGAEWITSPVTTAQRLLFLISILQIGLRFAKIKEIVTEVIDFYSNHLAMVIGTKFQSPAIDVLALMWLDPCPEIQNSARALYQSYIPAQNDSNILSLAEKWTDPLFSESESEQEDSILVLGLFAIDRFALLSPITLKQVSQLLSNYLTDLPLSTSRQILSVEILSHSFEKFQNYFDPTLVLRRLFILAMMKEDSNGLRGLARGAVERILEMERGFVVSTLCEDILHGAIPLRKDMIKLIGFLVKKQPLVLFTSLPRLVEAVVKSLDPAIREAREMVQISATILLNQLVKTFPSISFHGTSQRLAIGTNLGPIIIYDLSTATRLNVLTSHTTPVVALSFSEDGRRLVSASLEEGIVLVWKVGGVVAGFNPVAPLYNLFGLGGKEKEGKGIGEGGPSMSLEFIVSEGDISLKDTLEEVVFSWPAERTARLKIRETILTFSV